MVLFCLASMVNVDMTCKKLTWLNEYKGKFVIYLNYYSVFQESRIRLLTSEPNNFIK
jgi:hypothetical protein